MRRKGALAAMYTGDRTVDSLLEILAPTAEFGKLDLVRSPADNDEGRLQVRGQLQWPQPDCDAGGVPGRYRASPVAIPR